MENIDVLKVVLKAIVHHAEIFMNEEMMIQTKLKGEYRSADKIVLKKYTTTIGIGGTLNLLFYVTYNDTLLDNLTKALVYGGFSDFEFGELRESAAGEIANTIIGNALVDFPNRGLGVTITPPLTIEDAKSILKTNGAEIISASLTTQYGNIEFSVIGSAKGEWNA